MRLSLRPPGEHHPLEVDFTMILIALVAVAMVVALLYTLLGFVGSGMMGSVPPAQ